MLNELAGDDDSVKEIIYPLTKDERFLSQATKDILLF